MPATSKAQQRYMGMELAKKRAGEKTDVKMTEKQLKDFAGTKLKGLPGHVKDKKVGKGQAAPPKPGYGQREMGTPRGYEPQDPQWWEQQQSTYGPYDPPGYRDSPPTPTFQPMQREPLQRDTTPIPPYRQPMPPMPDMQMPGGQESAQGPSSPIDQEIQRLLMMKQQQIQQGQQALQGQMGGQPQSPGMGQGGRTVAGPPPETEAEYQARVQAAKRSLGPQTQADDQLEYEWNTPTRNPRAGDPGNESDERYRQRYPRSLGRGQALPPGMAPPPIGTGLQTMPLGGKPLQDPMISSSMSPGIASRALGGPPPLGPPPISGMPPKPSLPGGPPSLGAKPAPKKGSAKAKKVRGKPRPAAGGMGLRKGKTGIGQDTTKDKWYEDEQPRSYPPSAGGEADEQTFRFVYKGPGGMQVEQLPDDRIRDDYRFEEGRAGRASRAGRPRIMPTRRVGTGQAGEERGEKQKDNEAKEKRIGKGQAGAASCNTKSKRVGKGQAGSPGMAPAANNPYVMVKGRPYEQMPSGILQPMVSPSTGQEAQSPAPQATATPAGPPPMPQGGGVAPMGMPRPAAPPAAPAPPPAGVGMGQGDPTIGGTLASQRAAAAPLPPGQARVSLGAPGVQPANPRPSPAPLYQGPPERRPSYYPNDRPPLGQGQSMPPGGAINTGVPSPAAGSTPAAGGIQPMGMSRPRTDVPGLSGPSALGGGVAGGGLGRPSVPTVGLGQSSRKSAPMKAAKKVGYR